jgi:hypothetical protein
MSGLTSSQLGASTTPKDLQLVKTAEADRPKLSHFQKHARCRVRIQVSRTMQDNVLGTIQA